MDLITNYLSSSTLSSSLWLTVAASVGVAFLANFLIGCVQQRSTAARSVAGIPGPPGHWLKGHIDYVGFNPFVPLSLKVAILLFFK